MERRMPLGNKIGLAGEPEAIPLGVGKHCDQRIIGRGNGSFCGCCGSLGRSIGLLRRESLERKQAEARKEQVLGAISWKGWRHINYSELI
jgi:hypothetical protein